MRAFRATTRRRHIHRLDRRLRAAPRSSTRTSRSLRTATNRVGDPHTFTATVNVNDGTGGFVAHPTARVITFTTVDTRRHVDAEPAHRSAHERRLVHDDDHVADDRHLDRDGPHDGDGRLA